MSEDTSECRLSLPNCSRFSNLRGMRWRTNLGILSSSSSIEELRRSAADSRRRYANLRRALLIHPHLPKDGRKCADPSMDNPLSQNPESTWGRFFQNVELEKLLDRDLSRLYPEYENYFHSSGCQNILRRVLLVWCLRHPEYGYRQGMHELLAPLLYVLHADLQFLSQIRSVYGDSFDNEFNHSYFSEGSLPSNYCFTKDSRNDRNCNFQEECNPGITTLDDLDPETEELFLLSDPYGAEGELGVIFSEHFMEHDSYNMFDSLMSGAHGVVAMAEFFSPSQIGVSTSTPPVIEASMSLYHLLSVVDPSLHSHLIELGVEPQYFALRWLRVLFGREFSLDNLLIIWDEIFFSSNDSTIEYIPECSFKLLCSPRGAFIAALAVAMLLHVRPSLLASEYAASCLQRLLNFPKNISVEKLIQKAKSWKDLVPKANIPSSVTSYNTSKLEVGRLQSRRSHSRSHSLPQLNLLKTVSQHVPDSYWEEKWRMVHKDFTAEKNSGTKIMKLFGDKFGLCRIVSDPSLAQKESPISNVGHSILNNFAKVTNKLEFNEEKDLPEENTEQSSVEGSISHSTEDEICCNDSSSIFSSNSPQRREIDHDNISENSSIVASNSFAADNDEVANHVEEISDISVASNSDSTEGASEEVNEVVNKDDKIKQGAVVKERKLLSGALKWIFRFGRGKVSEKGTSNVENTRRNKAITNVESCSHGDGAKLGNGEKMGTLKIFGKSILDHVQVIESAFQQDSNKGQITAIAALKELRKISNILSEMQ